MKKKLITKSLILPIMCVLLLLTSCIPREFEYRGDYPELYSVALNSLLGAIGYEPSKMLSPTITVLETDNYGRILFSYSENSVGDIPDFSHIIIQKSDDGYAYFYSHYNFVSGLGRHSRDEAFYDLKEANSWNREMSDDSKFERVRIVRRKEDGPISDNQLFDVYHEVFPGVELNRHSNPRVHMRFFRTDDYGRSIYIGIGDRVYIVAIFQPDYSFDLETDTLDITSINNYQTELRLFMEANGWNTPP